jgi:hypothetical protein
MNTPRPTSDKKIETTLRLLAQARPAEDFERRLYDRLSEENLRVGRSFFSRAGDFFLAQRLGFAAAAATLACTAIVVGSVQHSHQRTLPNTGVHLSAPASGLGAASSTHISPQPVAAPEHGRSRSERKATAGRATVPRNAHKPAGVAVPESTDPQKP